MRYYFNIKDGTAIHDDEGIELDDMEAVKTEALRSSVDMMKGLENEHFWTGDPWLLWVTDQPNGGGNTILTLTFNARLAAESRARSPLRFTFP
jgi:hypothetical protein